MNYEIIGCGAADRGDDAAGLLVVRSLRDLGINAREHCADGAALIESWSGRHAVILIDAVVTGGAPGELTVWDGSKAPVAADSLRSSTHAFSVAQALTLAGILGRMPPRLLIYGIEGRRFDLGCAPSPEVVAASRQLAHYLRWRLRSLQPLVARGFEVGVRRTARRPS
jgi:hydrogenase maturation protease